MLELSVNDLTELSPEVRDFPAVLDEYRREFKRILECDQDLNEADSDVMDLLGMCAEETGSSDNGGFQLSDPLRAALNTGLTLIDKLAQDDHR